MNSAPEQSYSVGEFTHYVKFILEGAEGLRNVWISGEISNLTKHSSGHVYFTLKDKEASLSVAMFRRAASNYRVFPPNGTQVFVRGTISVYPPRGNYQLIAEEIKRVGVGDLHLKFIELKTKLEGEGLFEAEYKRSIPQFPRKIGIVTSPTGAVIRDILNTVKRRYPHVTLLLAPTAVQGAAAPAAIVKSVELLNEVPDLDTIIIARGGGSLEDLWGFNDEKVARAIFESNVPVISGVGHETDFTIADFVADRRASTPTAAAELSVPNSRDLRAWLMDSEKQMKRSLSNFIDFRRQMLDDYANRMESALKFKLQKVRGELDLLESKLKSSDIRKILKQGYSMTYLGSEVLHSPKKLTPGDELRTILHEGVVTSTVLEAKTIELEESK